VQHCIKSARYESSSLSAVIVTMPITLHYRTGWDNPQLHYSFDGGNSWHRKHFNTARVSPIGPEFRVVTVALQSPPSWSHPFEFVPTDGDTKWDNPAAECDLALCNGKNYSVDATAAATYVLFGGRLTRFEPGKALKTSGLTIVTDIDGTLYGNPEALHRLNELWCRELALAGAFLVYNTGRDVASVVGLIRENRKTMPVPIATVTRVGGFCHWFRPNPELSNAEWLPFDNSYVADSAIALLPYKQDMSWHLELNRVCGWDHRRYRIVLDSLIADDRGHWLEDGKNCDAQGAKCFQIAASIRAEHAESIVSALKVMLVDEPVKYIMSGEGEYRYLDITIVAAGKLGGTRHVVDQLPGESGKPDNVVFCGDSGNDFDALQGDIKGIVVGNAQAELLDKLKGYIDLPGGLKSTVTKDHAVVMTTAGFADGIIEGLQAHGFL
jgi:hydroxymethylpyrimidine pyrophosphatase-like HAD family hydrolase